MGNQTRDQELVLDAIAQLQRLSDAFVKRRAQLARGVGLSEQQWRVLEEISTEHFIPSMFARSQESSAAAVSKILRQLLDKGLVAVSVSSSDGRQREYELTTAGRDVMRKLRADRQRAIDQIWARFSRQELTRFCNFATGLTQSIEHYASSEDKE